MNTRGQFEYRYFDLSFLKKQKLSLFSLNVALAAFLLENRYLQDLMNNLELNPINQLQYMNDLQTLLFVSKLFYEIRNSEQIDKTNNSFFLYLMKLTLTDDDLKPGTAPKTDCISLKISLASLSYYLNNVTLLEPAAPLMVECEHMLTSTVKRNLKKSYMLKDKYPKFVTYLLQNYNHINLRDFIGRAETQLPLGINLRGINFLFESIALFADKHMMTIEIKKNEIIQSPDVVASVLDSITFEQYEEKLSRKLVANEIASQAFEQLKVKLQKVKLSVWKVILVLWFF